MSHVWKFSPSSEPLLQRCIEAALLQETDNNWSKHFGRKNISRFSKSDTPPEKTTIDTIEIPTSPAEEQHTETSVTYEDFFDSIASEIRLDFIANECSKNPNLFLKMAQRLSVNTVEMLFNHVFATKDIENSFMTDMFYKFLPLYIKLQYSFLCIDLLAKINENYPRMFQNLLRILLEDTDIPNQVLNNYIITLDTKNVTVFMESMSNIEMSSESFVHNILMLYTAYKNCKKTEDIQSYIKTNLLLHSKSCASDKNYGRLFLAYLQTEKILDNKIAKQIESCLELHHSPFKRACVVLLKELVQNE